MDQTQPIAKNQRGRPVQTSTEMIITVKQSSLVRPNAETPVLEMWISNADLVVPRMHVPLLYFFRSNGAPNFFESDLLKESLSRALVSFYPLAGRLKRDRRGRIEIDCNAEGALFVEAYSDTAIDDFGDFAPTMELKRLAPKVDYTEDISSFPLVLIQVTFFKCGGVSLCVSVQRHVVDGASTNHFINTWSDITRGVGVIRPPFIDRTLLRARVPPNPAFPHVEFQEAPTMKTRIAEAHVSPVVAIFDITPTWLDRLKRKAQEDGGTASYTTYEVLAGHVWRCVCQARNLQSDQPTKMYIAANCRSRLQPPLPPEYFGNAVFAAAPLVMSGDLMSKPLKFAAEKIHEAIVRMDNEYLRSALDYLELLPDPDAVKRGAHTFECPNIGVISWAKQPSYEADFGWGRPVFMGPAGMAHEGQAFVLRSPKGDSYLCLAISLHEDCMRRFRQYFYDLQSSL
ncbi:shikimate O-hydroxycinnamoyltransferase [Amborella trichopoda]|uniref:Uncharacterized protein n=1 Tax=Amborella trichopoda TaxID=13333 RepID=W1NFH2_AMBTC|nr:shikimate O-hydroxycinnamoyltransferase [Amborella trichopoda]ERM93925.1 hypothetical protein AMTR_s00137p00072760 [Amborella trichopoda]|eukprot:XP_006826688.1 shikimate O-hydroxycinnamoyltransferase [Amborella trichopoda]